MGLICLMNIFQIFFSCTEIKDQKTGRKTNTQEIFLYKTYLKLHYMKNELFLKNSRWEKQLKLEIWRQKWLEKHKFSHNF